MTPPTTLLLSFSILVASYSYLGAADELYVNKVTQNNGGKPLIMKFQEIERKEKTSIVKVSFESGTSVASAMFIAKGCYEIAKQRKTKFFINLKEWESPKGEWMYLIGFCNSTRVDVQKYFNTSEEHDKDDFMSVKEFEPIFKNN